ncbi:MAG: 3'(2'),5'-bisphosphate nucleotidase CysQ [Hyphomicrobiaceae bacterium]|nr:3'(2'),5'-bisphosphate nucleotidase CysQ [Hyphomicrobiaceae bacterium]
MYISSAIVTTFEEIIILKLRALKAPLLALVRSAGARIMDLQPRGCGSVNYKKNRSPVTEADHVAENCILPVLKKLTPNIAIISEENPVSHATKVAAQFWLVDALDGTKEFLKPNGQGAFTVNIALIEHQIPILGIIFAPAFKRLFYGDSQTGAWEMIGNSQKSITTSNIQGRARRAVTSASHLDTTTISWLRSQGISQTKHLGSSLKFCALALGEADIYPRLNPTMEWDTAAGDAILRAAGGMTTTLDFQPFLYGKVKYRNTSFIAWNKSPRPNK